MTLQIFSSDAFLVWHDWAWIVAVCLLSLVFAIVSLQFLFSGSIVRGSRFLYGRSLRSNLIIAFVLIGAIPTAALGVILAERSAHARHVSIADRLERDTSAMANDVNYFLEMYVAGITTAAAAVSESGRFDAETLSRTLLRNHETYTAFLTMLATDREGNVLVATSNMSGFLNLVPDLVLQSVSDRSYFQEPMRNGATFVSEAFQGRGLGHDPIVAISAVIHDADDMPVGVIEGSLNLAALSDLQLNQTHVEGATTLMLDRNDRVIFAPDVDGLVPLETLTDHPWITSVPQATKRKHYSFMADDDADDDAGGKRYLGAFASTQNGWKVFVRVPLSRIALQMQSDYAVSGLLIVIACLLSLFAAGAIIRRVSRSVGEMNAAISNFTADGTGEKINTPDTTPREFLSIFTHMRKRAKNLRRAHQRLSDSIAAGDKLRSDLRQTIAGKEAEILERTAALEEANELLASHARSDALTGIPNRREFDTFRSRIWRACTRNKSSVGIVMVDIDYFKIYNDNLGHQEGDDCLKRVAQALHGCATRPLDLVARYGGEEFGVILGNATLTEALEIAERMRQSVLKLGIQHPGSSHKFVSVSAGAAAVIPGSGTDADELLKAADEALYYAKAAGRNCAVFRRNGEYVTYDADDYATSETNVIAILSGKSDVFRR